ncbi:MAG: single-stranded DNA-binding protein, partial [Leptotrichia sp.]|nr:single-stranded DNA-binding protein [Leptotrichia sp.]
GRRIALQGRLSVNSYEKNGETRWSTEVIVDKFEFVDTVNSTGGQSSYTQPKKSENSFANNNNNDNDEIMDDDDFPF